MKRSAITPARIVFGEAPDEPPFAPDYGDIYHPRIGALAQARHVFLGGNDLPARWAGRGRFTVLEVGFGLGNNVLATWDAWRADPQRCERLQTVSIERHPPLSSDLQRAHAGSPLPELAAALVQAWPPLTPGLHELDFDGGRVRITLVFGDATTALPTLRLQADAVFLDGFAPAHNPELWSPELMQRVARLCAPEATVATWSVARALHANLRSAGFNVTTAPGVGNKREITRARLEPRFTPRRLPSAVVAAGSQAVVVGAGLAGAAAAQALARQGLAVLVLEAADGVASGASGNPAGLFHGSLNADDGAHARLLRAAALLAAAEYRRAFATGRVAGRAEGLLRLATADTACEALQRLLTAQGLPPDYVQALDAASAGESAGLPLPGPAWLYPGGGWVAPADWVAEALRTPGITLRTCAPVQSLLREGSGWRLLGPAGETLAQSPLVVLAQAHGTAALLAPLGHAPWPLRSVRGQVSHWATPDTRPKRPLAGDGYAIAMGGMLLCGATRQPGDDDATVREADHLFNIERVQRLAGLAPPPGAVVHGRVGWRLETEDHLPIAGAMPLAQAPAGSRLDQPRLLAREPGLFVLTALGARGLTLAPLLGRLVAAMATGAPWPLEQDLCDAIDPARWQVRAARRRGAQPG